MNYPKKASKKTMIGLICILCLLQISCKRKEFFKFDNDTVFLQICGNQDHLLKAVNVGDEGGAQVLQLFDKDLNLIEEVWINTIPFQVVKWNKDTIEVRFMVSNLDMFLPWFTNNPNKPLKIGQYKIVYSYIVIKETKGYTNEVKVDSIGINKREFKANLFVRGQIVKSVKIDSLSIFIDRVEYSDAKTRTDLVYHQKDDGDIRKFMQALAFTDR